jgi:predicted nuclease with TOPRIM domain
MDREKVIKKIRAIKSKIKKLEKEQDKYYFAHDMFEMLDSEIYGLEKEYEKLFEKLKPNKK